MLTAPTKRKLGQRFVRAMLRDKYLYLIMLLPCAYYVLFCYLPMYGVLIAFKNVKVFNGMGSILKARSVGSEYFEQYLTDPYFWKLVRNTVLIRVYSIVWSFPVPILFALLLNEIRSSRYKRLIQTVTYLPHFISLVVICGMMRSFLATDGIVNQMIVRLGGAPIQFLAQPRWFRSVYIASGVWQSFGWNSIIYLAALTSINPELYEAARLDGAGRFRQALHISIPGIQPTIVILFIMQMGSIMNVGYEKILLLYSGATMDVADVISTYVYRRGIIDSKFNYGTAVGLFTSVIGFAFLVAANRISRAVGETSLW